MHVKLVGVIGLLLCNFLLIASGQSYPVYGSVREANRQSLRLRMQLGKEGYSQYLEDKAKAESLVEQKNSQIVDSPVDFDDCNPSSSQSSLSSSFQSSSSAFTPYERVAKRCNKNPKHKMDCNDILIDN